MSGLPRQPVSEEPRSRNKEEKNLRRAFQFNFPFNVLTNYHMASDRLKNHQSFYWSQVSKGDS